MAFFVHLLYMNNYEKVSNLILQFRNIKIDDKYLIAGKKITGFTQTEEFLSGKNKLVPFATEKVAKERGANFTKKRFFSSYAVQDGQLITGQNPMSGRAVAKLLVENLTK